ncbi:MAG: dTMP kinase [Gammaproteobacteria bacterium]|nr:dTMP kinase [Gammaproteobacteria bacterium]
MGPHDAGRFITLEGIEGVGKSTNREFVVERLRSQGIDVVVTREPGGVPLAERIREILLAPDSTAPTADAELLLMFAARACHLEQLIRPALARGQWVVCDRFTDASYAYQGAGRGCGSEAVRTLEALVQKDFRPDLTLLLDADWDVSSARRAKRGTSDRFEQETRLFFETVRVEYLRRAALEPQRVSIVAAGRSLSEVQSELGQIIDRFVSRNFNKKI